MIKITREDNRAVIETAGKDIVEAHVPELRSRMREALLGGVSELVVDLANARMVDSTGIGLLLSAHNSLRRSGGKLAVIHASAEILDMFHVLQMHQHFSISGV